MVIENCTTFTEDEIAHYSKIFETIQTIKKLINAKVELNNELNKTFVLRFLKLKKLREQIQNIDNELKSLYKKTNSHSSHTSYAKVRIKKRRKYAYFLLNTPGYADNIDDYDMRGLKDLTKSPYL